VCLCFFECVVVSLKNGGPKKYFLHNFRVFLFAQPCAHAQTQIFGAKKIVGKSKSGKSSSAGYRRPIEFTGSNLCVCVCVCVRACMREREKEKEREREREEETQ